MRTGVALVVLAACSDPAPPAPAAPAPVPAPVPAPAPSAKSAVRAIAEVSAALLGGGGCELLPFAASTPVPEASGAAWIDFGGKPALLVAGDSGNHGAYGIVDADSGATLEQGRLPLGGASDDIEGLAAVGSAVYGIVSPGWILRWTRAGSGFALVDGPYPLGPVDLAGVNGGFGDKPPAGSGMVCDEHGVNCGRNYEGLCLAPSGSGGAGAACLGYAAAKADGNLYCLTADSHGRLVVHGDRSIHVDRPGALADCAYSDTGQLWAADNLFGFGQVFRVDPAVAGGRVTPAYKLPVGFPEVIAARGDVIYRMSDLGGAPSLMAKFRCPAPTK